MSEEEKKAIEYWKRDIQLYHYNTQLASEYYAQIVLNLIEKQQKELNNQKEKNEKLLNEIIEKELLIDGMKELLENETIDISGFRCIAVEDIENLLEE